MSSHRFSILAKIGLETACAWRFCWSWQAAGAALKTVARVAAAEMEVAGLLVARPSEERSMATCGVESVEQLKGKGGGPVEGSAAANGSCL